MPNAPSLKAPPLAPKAVSVDRSGAPDGFVPGAFFRPELLEGGVTRLVVSVPPMRLEAVHMAVIGAMEPPFKLRYVQLTDRAVGQLLKPTSHVAVEIPADRLEEALTTHRRLVYHDGRHQVWIQDLNGIQVVLEEIGMMYIYPDDPSLRDALVAAAVHEGDGSTLAEQDYIRVHFDAAADQEEQALFQRLNLLAWNG